MNGKIQGLIQLVFVVIFIFGSFALSNALVKKSPDKQKRAEQDRVMVVQTVTAESGPYALSFETTGIVEARAEVAVVPQVSGRVITINDAFFEGGTFEKDEILFEIEPKDFELEVRRLEAEVARAATALDLERAESKAARMEWEQFNEGKAPPALVLRKPQMAEARATLKAAQAQLDNAKLDLERTKFSLPFAGRVLSGDLEIGQFVSAGQSYGRAFNIWALEVNASLEDRQIDWMARAKNPEVIVNVTYQGQEKTYKAFLKRGAAALDAGTRFARVSFGFEKEVADLVPGVFATLNIQGPKEQDVTRLPASALQNNGLVWHVNKDSTLAYLIPDILFADDTQIVLRGVIDGTQIVTSKLSGATEGTRVVMEGDPDQEAQ